MKYFLIRLLIFLSIITFSCKKERINDIPVDDSPLAVTTLLPLSDDIPYSSLGSGKILFERKYNQGGSVFYIMDADKKKSSGFKLNSLTTQPYISPDGNKIACSLLNSSDSQPNWNIYIMNTDGTSCFPAFQSNLQADYPTWNLDGSKIIFYTSGNNGRLYMQSPVKNSSDTVKLTEFHYTDDPQWLIRPSGGFTITPDGNLIGVSNSKNPTGIIGIKPYIGKSGVSVLISPSTDLTFVSPNFGVESPVISPDGLKIAFLSIYSNPLENWISLTLYTMNTDGTNLLVTGGIGGYKPTIGDGRYASLCWSPDETKILFAFPDGENASHLFVVNLDGSGYSQVTNQSGVFDSNVSWSR
jgi:Tol biopolymer transport system component